MKKIISFLFILFLSFSNICFSQSGWFWQNPLPSYSDYKDVKFINSLTGCAVGSNNTIIRTTDGGISWKIVRESYQTAGCELLSLFFVNQTTGFASGRKIWEGLICKTTNGGANWTEYYTNRTTPLYSIFFTNVNTGYTVGNYSLILKTSNCGTTWDTLTRSTSGNYLSIFFINDNTGFIGSNGFMLKTTNAGLNWFNVNINLSSHDVKSIYFIDQNTGFTFYSWIVPPYSFGTSIFKTTNCGLTWSNQSISNPTSEGLIRFLNLTTGYICGYYNFIKTTNCGVNWFSTYSISSEYVNSVDLVNDSIVFAVGKYGNIFKGDIRIDNFTNISSLIYQQNNSIIFVDQSIGYIAGYDGILKTTNSGVNWQKLVSPYTTYTDISFSDSNHGYACTFSGQAVKTTNGGANWEILSYVNNHGGHSILAINKDTVFYLPANGSIVDRSINGGYNWSSIEIASWNVNLYDICFINSKTGYITRIGNSQIAKTTNTGDNWFVITLDVDASTYRIKKIDSLNLYASAFWTGYSSGVIISTNGGINWTRYSISSDYTGDVDFVNKNTGYFLTSGNYNSSDCRIWKTTNKGVNWFEQMLPFQKLNNLDGVKFLNQQTGFAIGYCLILKTTNGGWPIGINNGYTDIPSSFSLSQNYPNPFNPVTRIKYQIPLSRGLSEGRGVLVKLIIYDILGREIETLVNDTQKPGSYEVPWDGSRYASGVYFYRLYVDDASAPLSITKKMVLIK